MAGWSPGHITHPVFPLHLSTVSDLHLQAWFVKQTKSSNKQSLRVTGGRDTNHRNE